MAEQSPTGADELQLLVLRCQAGDERAFAQLIIVLPCCPRGALRAWIRSRRCAWTNSCETLGRRALYYQKAE